MSSTATGLHVAEMCDGLDREMGERGVRCVNAHQEELVAVVRVVVQDRHSYGRMAIVNRYVPDLKRPSRKRSLPFPLPVGFGLLNPGEEFYD